MKIIITGGCGFIGNHLAKLLSDKHDIIVIDDESRNGKIFKYKNIKYIKKSILSSSIEKYFENTSIVFHLAAKISIPQSILNPGQYFDVNLKGTQNILDMCVKYKINKIIFSSTSAIYENKLNLSETDAIDIKNMYSYSKYSAENLIILYQKLYNLNYIILRYFNVFGENANKDSVIENFLHNKKCNIHGSGNQLRDFIYVQDVVKANLLSMNYNKNDIFNVGSGNAISIKSIAEYTKYPINYTTESMGIIESSSNINKINKELLWKPTLSVKDYISNKI